MLKYNIHIVVSFLLFFSPTLFVQNDNKKDKKKTFIMILLHKLNNTKLELRGRKKNDRKRKTKFAPPINRTFLFIFSFYTLKYRK